eukprot:CAMPEP_0176003108 /NCGR_PEP_ID=MMETSP0120_2-20121206/1000_1 /TAXON_ID=160619 /ORGANISM="Kryptoperidinium foliaceum, Strain CCMP 1326" /LENGTH=196 /DNA_ID=CAMNT_0017335733 /DNA_START=48 /DNA_END=634 /DNA_ORIENTATION=+
MAAAVGTHTQTAMDQLLLLSHENEENDDVDVIDCCNVLSMHLLQSFASSNQKTLRDVLGERVSHLSVPVIPLLQDRVALPQLLPATQDVAGEEEVLNENIPSAQTLTRTALQAAHLYALVLSHNGSLGSGWVDLEGLTALTSVLQRWSSECCGREAELTTGGERKQEDSLNTSSPPKKRTRRNEDEDEEDSDFEGD